MYLEKKLGVTVGSTVASRWTGKMKCMLIESSRLSLERSISDEGLRFVNIVLSEESCRFDHLLDLHPMIVIS